MRKSLTWQISLFLVSVILVFSGCGKGETLTDKVIEFRAAKDAGDYETAKRYMVSDARVWYEEKTGEGMPYTLGAGAWKSWDDHFNSTGGTGDWTVEGNSVWAIATESNDYFRLLERETISQYRITYFFNEQKKITGYMISAAYPGQESPPKVDRFDEFEAWVLEHHADEWEYLRPGGKLDPSVDRAPRTRVLLNLWRAEVGLEVIE
ncbi:MAG: hypothetical protein IH914_03655 [candidate division Zixibacteria bacterium]|nr:hypothetical protein [candidate division Zixibacteria bacterium]